MTIEIPMKLPSLNDYIRWCRGNKFMAAKRKREIEDQICCYLLPLPKFTDPVFILFSWTEENKRRDYDNVAFAKKFILDALVKARKLKDDNRKCVVGFTDRFEQGKKCKVTITISEVHYGKGNTAQAD